VPAICSHHGLLASIASILRFNLVTSASREVTRCSSGDFEDAIALSFLLTLPVLPIAIYALPTAPPLRPSGLTSQEESSLLVCLCRQILKADPVMDVPYEEVERGLVGIARDPGLEVRARLVR